MTFQAATIGTDLQLFTAYGLLTEKEAAQVLEIVQNDFVFADAMERADSIHVHVNADRVDNLPGEESIIAARPSITGDDRERKFAFPSGLNVIFALDPTAQDELIPGAVTQTKPYVDHFGIDLRDETDDTRRIFDAIPDAATTAGWRHVAQEGPVRCCHVEMGPKHWVYPPEGPTGDRRPIEFAFGQLKMSDEYLGCDYRPIDPAHPLANRVSAEVPGCGPAAAPAVSTAVSMAVSTAQQAAVVLAPAVEPARIFVFEECSCNVAPSAELISQLRDRYPEADVRSFDLAKPEGLIPLPPALFLALQESSAGVLPALVVDGRVRTQGWLPAPGDAVALIETLDESGVPVPRPAASCCPPGGTCC